MAPTNQDWIAAMRRVGVIAETPHEAARIVRLHARRHQDVVTRQRQEITRLNRKLTLAQSRINGGKVPNITCADCDKAM